MPASRPSSTRSTGFLPSYEGRIALQGEALEGLLAHQRAQLGVRRTWQTNRIAPDLSVGAYLMLASGGLTTAQLCAALAWIGGPDPDQKIAKVDAGTRRMLDVAGVVAARPALALLDEPAAGQSYDEALRLAQRIAEIPRSCSARRCCWSSTTWIWYARPAPPSPCSTSAG